MLIRPLLSLPPTALLLSALTLEAATLSLRTGEVLQGTVIAVNEDAVVFRSDGLGPLTLERSLLTAEALASLPAAAALPTAQDEAATTARQDIIMPATESPGTIVSPHQPETAEDEAPFLNRVTGLPGKLTLTAESALTRVRNGNDIDTYVAELTVDWDLGNHELSTFHRLIVGEVNGSTVQEQRAHSLRYAWQFADRWIWLNQYDWFLDTTSLIDAKSQFVSAPGYYLLNNDRWTFLVGAGPGYLGIEYDTSPFSTTELGDFEANPSEFALFGYQFQRINFTEQLTLTQSLLTATAVDNDVNTAELRVSLSHALTENLAIILESESIYISEPLPDIPEWIENLSIMLQFKL